MHVAETGTAAALNGSLLDHRGRRGGQDLDGPFLMDDSSEPPTPPEPDQFPDADEAG